MKVKYKKGTSNFGFDGKEYPADKNGEADLPPDALAAAIEFGVLAGPDEQPDQEPSADDAKLLEILEGTVPEVVDAIAGLNIADLEKLAALELKGKDRSGVAEAIAEEIENTKDA